MQTCIFLKISYDVFQVLADYQSDEEPDFTNPSTFRDLSKPMVSNPMHP